MPKPTTLRDTVDEILAKYSTQNDDKSITLTWTSRDVVADLKAELLAAFKEAGERVIGEDETHIEPFTDEGMFNDIRNTLRADQRKTLTTEVGED